MTKKEKSFIRAAIEQYRKWAAEEESNAKGEIDPGDKESHYLQARLNESAADTLDLLLSRLEEI